MRLSARARVGGAAFACLLAAGPVKAARYEFFADIEDVGGGRRVVLIREDDDGNRTSYGYWLSEQKFKAQSARVTGYGVTVAYSDRRFVFIPYEAFDLLDAAQEPGPKAAAAHASIPLSTNGDTFDVACDASTAVAVGSSGPATVALVDLAARREVATLAYPGLLAPSVSVDDGGTQALVVVDNAQGNSGTVRRIAISGASLADTGEQLAFPGGEWVTRVWFGPGAKTGLVVVGAGASRLVSFSVPGLAQRSSIGFSDFVVGVAFNPAGDRIYIRRGSRGLADTIEARTFDAATGAIGATALWSTTAVSGFTGVVYQNSLVITPDGARLAASDENVGGSLPSPRIAMIDANSGAIAKSPSLPGGKATQLVAVLRACPSAGATRAAVEYRHAAFDHYFATSAADEIAKLDAGAFPGWSRTGRQFNVYVPGTANTHPTCRFFSTAFGPRSSHFYATSAAECAKVKSNPDWQFEGEVFATSAAAEDGTCAPPLRPLFRLYNDGQGGAPNHRYTTDTAVRAQMIGAGWVPEGAGQGVVACVPP